MCYAPDKKEAPDLFRGRALLRLRGFVCELCEDVTVTGGGAASTAKRLAAQFGQGGK